MIELPEAYNLARQINDVLTGKRIAGVVTGHTPHKLAWFYGDPSDYSALLIGQAVERADPRGGLVEIKAGRASVLFGEGVNLRFHAEGAPRPAKHQMMIEFTDRSALSASVQMYGGMGAFPFGKLDNLYYRVAKEKPSPLSDAFDERYFRSIADPSGAGGLSLKALLATEQRIPGLGNGVLQDILFNARLLPKRRLRTLDDGNIVVLFQALKGTLSSMTEQGGRDTEMDLFGSPGGYRTLLCKNTSGRPCRVCGGTIRKEAYMGGSVYFCPNCQR